ncbi:glycosyltransferase family 4 protein [Microbacterium sp. 69-7]|uniref:glycosyltransferase family 4 protein n=1 Tax=Microbacterium sp. 69-7 TaxID=1895784 RepID=UPI000A5F9A63|nr:glycosyltransferase family 4 protein [Microbacterium sp. 69-7]
MDTTTVISNPGSIPELTKFAEWSLANDRRIIFASPIAINSATSARLEGSKVSLLSRVGASMRARSVDHLSKAEERWQCATVQELQFLRARRVSPTGSKRQLSQRNERFDTAVAARVRRHGKVGRVLVRSTAGLQTLRAVRGSGEGILDYPIVHHDVMARIIREESRAFPQLAHTFAGDVRSVDERKQLDEEIQTADRVLTLSEPHRLSFVNAGVDPGRLITVPLGVDLRLFKHTVRSERDSRRHLIFSGQVVQRKGIGYLFQLMQTLPTNYHLTIAGFAPDPSVIPADERITYVGSLTRPRLAELYRSGSVFIFPSLAEGFAQTPLEALASGLPAVVSDTVYGSEGPVVDGVNGFLVNPRDVDQMRDRVTIIAENPELHRAMSEQAAAAASAFTWQRFSESLDRHFGEAQ